ncbi:MAG: hypothetical protein MK097_21510, partial [Dechloromonas sp.]|nr:hypothetical protein [Dechloromonas sp.]
MVFMALATLFSSGISGSGKLTKRRSLIAWAWATTASSGLSSILASPATCLAAAASPICFRPVRLGDPHRWHA